MLRPMISIIIVNYNTPLYTAACIRSIFNEVISYPFEVIVVDNASKDSSVNDLKSEFGDRINLIESDTNLGFGRANNLGASLAKGKYLFFLNSDTVLLDDPFIQFVDFYESHNGVGMLGCYLVDGQSQYTLSGGNTYSIKKYLKVAFNGLMRRTSPMEIERTDTVQKVDYVIGADIFIEASLFKAVGGFDPHIFMYFEDVELCSRLTAMRKTNYLLPGIGIVHFVNGSTPSQFSRVYNTASLMYCLRKKYGAFKFSIFQFLYFLMKMPLLLRLNRFKDEVEYVLSIYNYKKYLVKQ